MPGDEGRRSDPAIGIHQSTALTTSRPTTLSARRVRVTRSEGRYSSRSASIRAESASTPPIALPDTALCWRRSYLHTRRQRCVSTSRHAVQGDERIFAGERRGRDAPSSRAHDAWTGSAVIWIGHRPLAAPVASRSRGVSPVQGGSNHPTCERWIGYGRSTRVASSPLPKTTFASDHAVGRSRPHLSRAARHRYPIAWIAQAELESACSGGKGSLPPHSIVRASRRAHSSSARSLKRSRAGSAPCAEERCDTARLRRPGVRRRGGRGPRRRCSRRCRGVCGRQNAVGAPQSARSDRSEHDGRRSAARCLPRVRAVGRSRRRPLAGHRRGTPCVAPAPCERAPRTRPPTTGTTT